MTGTACTENAVTTNGWTGFKPPSCAPSCPHLDGWTEARRAIAGEYVAGLGGEVEVLEESAESPCTYHVFPIRVRARDRLVRELTRAGISTRIHYPLALPDQPALHNLYPTRSVVTARDWASREAFLADLSRHDPDAR